MPLPLASALATPTHSLGMWAATPHVLFPTRKSVISCVIAQLGVRKIYLDAF